MCKRLTAPLGKMVTACILARSAGLMANAGAMAARSTRRLNVRHMMMASVHSKYVVLGAGQSGGYVAKNFVDRGLRAGELTLVGEEDVLPYERPTLSKAYLVNEETRLPKFHTSVGGGGEKQDQEWYDKHGVLVLRGSPVTKADLDAKLLTTESGDEVKYDTLILASGSGVMRMDGEGSDLDGIHYLRHESDAKGLVKGMKAAKERGGKAVIIGGGYIGMECAAGLVKNGLETTLVFPGSRLMERLFVPKVADMYEEYYQKQGVKILKNAAKASSFRGDNEGHVTGVKLDDGTVLDANLVLVGIGAVPRIELFSEDKGESSKWFEMQNRGIKVDGHFKTTRPDVYAIGDIATFPLKMYGDEPTRTEHVAHARASAAHAVSAILDPDNTPPYDYLPFFYSREFELGWKFYGQNAGDDIVVGDLESYLLTVWVDSKSGRVNGVFLESRGDDKYTSLIQRLARDRPELSGDHLRAVKGAASAEDALKVLESALEARPWAS